MKKNILLLSFMMLIAALFTSSYASEFDQSACRERVVEAAAYFKVTLDKDTFGTATFESLNVTAEIVNNMSSVEQKEIYDKIKPLEIYALDYQEALRKELNAILDFAYRNNAFVYFVDTIEDIQKLKSNLEEACNL